MNRVFLMGNLGKDPETRTTQSGKEVCNFSLATTRGSGDQKTTQWHHIVAFGKTAEICGKYLAKGSKVLIEGELTYRDWTDKDGNKRTSTEIIASNMQFVGARDQSRQQASASSEVDDVSIPF